MSYSEEKNKNLYALRAGKEMNMKKNGIKKIVGNRIVVMMSLFLFAAAVLSGCGESDDQKKLNSNNAAGMKFLPIRKKLLR